MFTKLMKFTSRTGEQRWINFDRVTRISLANDTSDDPVLTICFEGQDHVKIHGTDEDSRILIRRIASSLDTAAECAGMFHAA